MNTESSAMSETLEPQIAAAVAAAPGRLLFWSLQREIWENRWIYRVPLAVGGLSVVAFLISTIHLPAKMRAASALGAMQQHRLMTQPYFLVGALMMLTTLAVGVFYCLDALHGERRDRSILFWKSLPVSDVTTVLSKIITPIIILPLIAFGVMAVTQWIMLLVSTAVLAASGMSVAALWTHASLFQMWLTMLYHLLTVHGLWYAPIYAWLLLVSAWARRAPFLWAALPPLVIAVVEKIAFNSWHFGAFMLNRLIGGPGGDDFMASTFSIDPLMHFTPGAFFVSPALWIGLAVAAAFLAAAVQLRRQRGPI